MEIITKDRSIIIKDMDWVLWYTNHHMNITLAIDLVTINMAEELFNTKMVQNILVNSITTINMDKASLLIDLAIYMKDNGNIIIEMGMALICI